MDLSARKAVIIGGTSGIGLATARLLASQGALVTVAGREPGRVEELQQAKGGVFAEVVDAASATQLKELYRRQETFHDLVLCVSGAKGSGPFPHLSVTDLSIGFEEKFFAQFRAAQEALPYLDKTGSITFVSAISARGASPGTSGLAAINGAIESMIKPLAKELKPLRVNAVSPGVVETGWWSKVPEGTRTELLARSAAMSLVGRNGQPEELAHAIVFLIANAFVTGTVLEVDGGMHLS